MYIQQLNYFSLEHLMTDKPVQEQRKFVVFESSLVSLLERCPTCTGQCKARLTKVVGSCITVEQVLEISFL